MFPHKLNGLVIVVEGTGRNAKGRVVFQALATISHDGANSTYHLRAYNDSALSRHRTRREAQRLRLGLHLRPREGRERNAA